MSIEKLRQAVESVDKKMRVSRYPTHDELNVLLAAARVVIDAVDEGERELQRRREEPWPKHAVLASGGF
jgi:hypothetical protein